MHCHQKSPTRRTQAVLAHLTKAEALFGGVAPADFRGSAPTEQNWSELREQGFTIVDNFLTPEEVAVLLKESRRLVSSARVATEARDEGLTDGPAKTPGYVLRTLPHEVMGPEGGKPGGCWGVRGTLDPDWGAPCFAEFYGSTKVMDYVCGFLDCTPNDLLIPDADAIIFCNPPGVDRRQRWHRDYRWWGVQKGASYSGRQNDGENHKLDFSEEAQRERWENMRQSREESISGHNDYLLQHGGRYIRWEVALVDDGDVGGLDLVPGSHNRFRTDVEDDVLTPPKHRRGHQVDGVPATDSRRGLANPSFADVPAHEGSAGSRLIKLKAGQACFWSGDCMHRGRSANDHERVTLSCSWSVWDGAKGVDGSDEHEASLPKLGTPEADKALAVAAELVPNQAWKISPHVREGLPSEWYKQAWDRWIVSQIHAGVTNAGAYARDRADGVMAPASVTS